MDESNNRGHECECSEWKAWHDRMPGGPATLHVTGRCECPAGVSIKLEPVIPQGINPSIYIFREIEQPEGGSSPTSERGIVHYTEETNKKYSHVEIRPHKGLIDVEEVQ
jgi:hypothetical protein